MESNGEYLERAHKRIHDIVRHAIRVQIDRLEAARGATRLGDGQRAHIADRVLREQQHAHLGARTAAADAANAANASSAAGLAARRARADATMGRRRGRKRRSSKMGRGYSFAGLHH